MILMNGQFYAAGAPEVTLLNRSFKYGDSLFETIRVYEGRLLFLEQHLDRLRRGMKVLKMSVERGPLESKMVADMRRLLERKQVTRHGYVRLQVYRSGGGTYTPIQNNPYYLIEANSLKDDPFQSTYRLHLVPYTEIPVHYDALSPFKTGNSLPYVLAGLYAQEQGADDAVLFNGSLVADTAGANLFLVRQQKIYTPPLSSGCLDGVMRRKVLQLCTELKLECAEKTLKRKDLEQADEVFLTNSVRGIREVARFGDLLYPPERAMSQFLKNCLQQSIRL